MEGFLWRQPQLVLSQQRCPQAYLGWDGNERGRCSAWPAFVYSRGCSTRSGCSWEEKPALPSFSLVQWGAIHWEMDSGANSIQQDHSVGTYSPVLASQHLPASSPSPVGRSHFSACLLPFLPYFSPPILLLSLHQGHYCMLQIKLPLLLLVSPSTVSSSNKKKFILFL